MSELDDALETLPPASEAVGDPGHDQALNYARGARLLRARAKGLTYEEIAEANGYRDASGARQALLRALSRHEAESAAELRTIEHHAYLADQRTLRELINDTNLEPRTRIGAIDARTRSAARYARLMGLDAPTQVTMTDEMDREIEQMLARLGDDGTWGITGIPDGERPDDEPADSMPGENSA